MLIHGTVIIELNPDKRGWQLRKIIPHLPAKVHEGLFFMVIIRNDKRH